MQLQERLLHRLGQHLVLALRNCKVSVAAGVPSHRRAQPRAARAMVKRSRDQSSEEPRRRSWPQMVFPYCSFHVNTW